MARVRMSEAAMACWPIARTQARSPRVQSAAPKVPITTIMHHARARITVHVSTIVEAVWVWMCVDPTLAMRKPKQGIIINTGIQYQLARSLNVHVYTSCVRGGIEAGLLPCILT